MVKVWNSAIDDEANKHRGVRKQIVKKKRRTKGESDFDDTLDDDDKPMVNRSSDDDDDKKIRTMIRLEDFDATLSIWAIESIEKKSRFMDTPRPRWQFGIVINAGIEPSMRFPKVDIGAWYEKEELRDQRYDELLSKLETYGFKILNW